MKFVRKVEEMLKKDIQSILDHSYIQRIRNGELSKLELQFFAGQYCIYCMHFPRFLAAVASNIEDDKYRLPIIKNLWEEHGEGILEKSHRQLYFKFSNALGLSQSELLRIEPLISTTICVENLMYLCQHAHFVESLGALGPGTEFFTSEEYFILFEGLKQYNYFTEKDLEFWSIHVGLDDEHYGEMMDILIPLLSHGSYQKMLQRGAARAVELEIMFWDGLEEHLIETREQMVS
jgi:pyrroloquinoline quinone (PQQ) biosynthesis protein C